MKRPTGVRVRSTVSRVRGRKQPHRSSYERYESPTSRLIVCEPASAGEIVCCALVDSNSLFARLLIGLLVALVPAPASASAVVRGVSPDRSFGNGKGWVVTRIPGTSATAGGIAVVRGGAIVVVGEAVTPSGNGQILVLRYRPNGQLDRSFASRGVFRSSLPVRSGPFLATSVVQDVSTGKLLVAGGYGLNSMLVLRLTRGGRLDRTFGRNRTGFATVRAGGIAQSIALQPNGGILLGGSNENVNGRPMVVARLTRSGVLDRKFGRGGLAQVLFWNPNRAAGSTVSSLATFNGGGVIGFGHIDYIGGDGHGSAGVFRLSANGRLVRAFGKGGHVEVAFANGGGNRKFAQWFPCAMTVDSRGRATITGDGSTAAGDALLTIRLTPLGLLDRSYGRARNGRSLIQGLNASSQPTCGAASTPGGRLTVAVGNVLAQLQPSGTANGRFGRGGMLVISRPPNVGINGVARSGRSSVVLAGFVGSSVYVGRYLLPAPS